MPKQPLPELKQYELERNKNQHGGSSSNPGKRPSVESTYHNNAPDEYQAAPSSRGLEWCAAQHGVAPDDRPRTAARG